MTEDQLDQYAEEVRALIQERLQIKGATLDRAVVRAGRLLPRWARRDGLVLARAQQVMGHPKLRRAVDEAAVVQAHKNLTGHLRGIDPSERRKTRVLGTLGVISFNIIVVTAALIAVLMWRGHL